MMDAHNKTIGAIAEQKAQDYLCSQGLRLIMQNYRCAFGEIDLIMRDLNQDIVFIEVRSRSSAYFGSALESVTRHKQKKIIKTALYFLQQQNWLTLSYRFDVIGLCQGQLQWIKNAFTADF
jgi:putative endonuclease